MMWLAAWANNDDYDCMRDDPGDVSLLANPIGIIVKELTPETIEQCKKMAYDEWADLYTQESDDPLIIEWIQTMDLEDRFEWEARQNNEFFGILAIRTAYEL